MSQRYTRHDAESAFELLCVATGHRIAAGYNDVGAWSLDYAPVYGGYVVHEIISEHGAIREPFGTMRRPAREFCSAVHFARNAIGSIQSTSTEASK